MRLICSNTAVVFSLNDNDMKWAVAHSRDTSELQASVAACTASLAPIHIEQGDRTSYTLTSRPLRSQSRRRVRSCPVALSLDT